MALTYTPPGELGMLLPKFELPAVTGGTHSSHELAGANGTVVMFICNHCPYVKAIETRLIELANSCNALGVNVIGICSNDSADYEEDTLENLKKTALEKDYPFVYLHDESQQVAKSFGAVCTPDFFTFNSAGSLYYRGRLDDSWKDSSKVSRHELFDAVKAMLGDKPTPEKQTPSMGCSIKWKES